LHYLCTYVLISQGSASCISRTSCVHGLTRDMCPWSGGSLVTSSNKRIRNVLGTVSLPIPYNFLTSMHAYSLLFPSYLALEHNWMCPFLVWWSSTPFDGPLKELCSFFTHALSTYISVGRSAFCLLYFPGTPRTWVYSRHASVIWWFLPVRNHEVPWLKLSPITSLTRLSFDFAFENSCLSFIFSFTLQPNILLLTSKKCLPPIAPFTPMVISWWTTAPPLL